MRNKLLGLSALAMAMSVNSEIGKDMPVRRLNECNPYANKICKSCKYMDKERSYCNCTDHYKKYKSKACKYYKNK